MVGQYPQREPSLTPAGPPAASRRMEAERLINLARALLTEPEEEIAAIYLDHAVDTLRALVPDPAS